MAGLARIARALGGITINGKEYVWDYVLDKSVPKNEMTKERWAQSERIRYGIDPPPTTPEDGE